MSKITTRDELKCFVYSRLGHPILRTNDLHNDQLDYIIDRSVDRFREQAIGFATEERVLYIPVEKGVTRYDISDVDPQPTAVLEVINSADDSNVASNMNLVFTVENMMLQQWKFSLNTPDLLTFQMIYNYLDFFDTMYGFRVRATINETAKTLQILPAPRFDGSGFFLVTTNKPEEEIFQYTWVQDYTLAMAFIQIGMNRIKYSGVALPGGGSLNGDMYISKGEEMKNKLDEELLLEWSEPPDFYVG